MVVITPVDVFSWYPIYWQFPVLFRIKTCKTLLKNNWVIMLTTMGSIIDCIKLIQNIICRTLDWGIPQLKFKDVLFLPKNIYRSLFSRYWYIFGILEFWNFYHYRYALYLFLMLWIGCVDLTVHFSFRIPIYTKIWLWIPKLIL